MDPLNNRGGINSLTPQSRLPKTMMSSETRKYCRSNFDWRCYKDTRSDREGNYSRSNILYWQQERALLSPGRSTVTL